jgi:hypothetical protein
MLTDYNNMLKTFSMRVWGKWLLVIRSLSGNNVRTIKWLLVTRSLSGNNVRKIKWLLVIRSLSGNNVRTIKEKVKVK